MSFTVPVTASLTIDALPEPQAMRTMRRAPRIVPQPIVIASVGTLSMPPNAGAASSRVIGSSVIARVSESFGEPGSLKPM